MGDISGCRFPFGKQLRIVEQTDRSPKDVFVLGVYSSAVHARWRDATGRIRVNALAVVSEPYIFWRGDGAGDIVAGVGCPPELGTLEPADESLNGPSGKALDDLVLAPLGYGRERAWLCDLIPYSCCNPAQNAAIKREYDPVRQQAGIALPEASIPGVPKELASVERRQEILGELKASRAAKLVLLGDEPIRWFFRHFVSRWQTLSDFGPEGYGEPHPVMLGDLGVSVIPMAHPRQIAALGSSSERWFNRHKAWMERNRSTHAHG